MSHVLLNLLAGPQTLLASPRTPPAGPRTPQNDPQGLMANQQGLRISQYGSESQPKKDGQTDGQTDRQTYGISLHFTGLCPLSGPLPKNGLRKQFFLQYIFGCFLSSGGVNWGPMGSQVGDPSPGIETGVDSS